MTRRRMLKQIDACLEEHGLENDRDIVTVAADCALKYLLEYATELSEQLILSGAYSEALTAGLLTIKIRNLLDE